MTDQSDAPSANSPARRSAAARPRSPPTPPPYPASPAVQSLQYSHRTVAVQSQYTIATHSSAMSSFTCGTVVAVQSQNSHSTVTVHVCHPLLRHVQLHLRYSCSTVTEQLQYSHRTVAVQSQNSRSAATLANTLGGKINALSIRRIIR
eukprot:3416092-Pyramimonas_sp.AAC.2